MPASFARELSVAEAAVRHAARLCQAVQGAITRETLEKKDRSPVTVADFGSQAVVCRALRAAFPSDAIVAEEDSAEVRAAADGPVAARVLQEVRHIVEGASLSEVCDWIDLGLGEGGSGRFWTLDPIDGTKGFLRGEQYAVALALLIDGQVQIAALACPNLPASANGSGGSVFTAVRGEGSRVMPLTGGAEAKVSVSRPASAAAARFCESVESGHSKHDEAAAVAQRLGITAAPRRLDSQAKYAVVARGEAEIYLRMPTREDYREKIWDHAAGALIIEEAGGRVTDVGGRPLDFRQGRELTNNRGIVATNGQLHDAVLQALREVAG